LNLLKKFFFFKRKSRFSSGRECFIKKTFFVFFHLTNKLAAQPSKKFIFQTLSKAKQGLAKIEKKKF
jgi:hypothetical protein